MDVCPGSSELKVHGTGCARFTNSPIKESGKKSGGVPHLFFREGAKVKSDSLWIQCGTCEKQISASAKSCPHCGARLKKKYRFLKWGGIGFAAFLALLAVAQSEADKRANKDAGTKQTEQLHEASDAKAVNLPSAQVKLLAVVDEYANRFRTAKNELQESSLRTARGDAFFKLVGSDLGVENWIGKITDLGTDSQDKAYIRVSIAPNVELVTLNMSALDVQGTMISNGTELYSNLMGMTEGDPIKLSGSFIPNGREGFYEASLTINGAMTEPAFLFRFSRIEKQ